jgi:aspartate beta-hydroxylase
MKVDYHIFKSALNWYLGRYVGGRLRPTIFDISLAYPELDAVTQAYPVIRAEFDRLMADWSQLPKYHEVDAGEVAISNTTPKNWSVFMLEVLGQRPALNRACCPKTCQVLERVPNLIQAFFSILDPGKNVPEHEGPYLGYLRYHLALRVPRHNPPKLVVAGRDYYWREGEAMLFDDSWPHAVVNPSNEMRAVLIVDVRRPFPMVPNLLNRFVTDVVGRHTYGRKVARKTDEFAAAARAISQRRRAA